MKFLRVATFSKKRPSTTGSGATALNTMPVLSPGLGQGSGSLQANEAISYGTVPLQYAKSEVPRKANVGQPIAKHTNFVVPTVQRAHPQKRPKVPSGKVKVSVQ